MARHSWIGALVACAAALCGCKITQQVDIVSANQADATLVLQYEHGLEDYSIKWDEVEDRVLAQCAQWGYSAAEFVGDGDLECVDRHERIVVGARPPGESVDDPSLGSRAAQRERDFRNMGAVGQSMRGSMEPRPPDVAEGCIRWRVIYAGRCTNAGL